MSIDLILIIIFYGLLLLFYFKNKQKFELQGGIFAIYRTKLGLRLMNKIAKKFSTVLKYLSYLSIFVGFIGMFVILYYLIKGTYALVSVSGALPVLAPVLPGVQIANLPVLSFWNWIISILLVAVVHEFMHGVFSRYYNIKIKSSGFAFLGPILAAFVEPDEKKLAKKPKISQMAVVSAGPFSNIIFAFVVLLLTFFIISPVTSNTMSYEGVQIIDIEKDYPASEAGLAKGDAILSINNISINNITDFKNLIENIKPNEKITITTTNTTFSVITAKNPQYPDRGYLGVSIAPMQVKIKESIISKYGKILPALFLWIAKLFFWLFVINLGVGLFNLLPLGPVDGGRLLTLGLSYFVKDKKLVHKFYVFISIFCLLLIFINLLPYILKLFLFIFSLF
ncbi:MAG: site-2 protease family protein [Nanoarchaeota archaeon]